MTFQDNARSAQRLISTDQMNTYSIVHKNLSSYFRPFRECCEPNLRVCVTSFSEIMVGPYYVVQWNIKSLCNLTLHGSRVRSTRLRILCTNVLHRLSNKMAPAPIKGISEYTCPFKEPLKPFFVRSNQFVNSSMIHRVQPQKDFVTQTFSYLTRAT